MKTVYKFLPLLLVFAAVSLNAQQLTTPMDFRVTAPGNIAGSYEYGYQSDWGPTVLEETVAGDLAWGFTAAGDSLACTPITTNLTGKIAVVRRGACSFSLKAYHAQQAGAVGTIILNNNAAEPTTIVNMLGGDSAAAVVTPAVFLTYGDGVTINTELQNGVTVGGAFFVPKIDDAFGLLHFATPQSQIVPLDAFKLTVFNNSTNPETNVVATVTITDPSGNVATLTESVSTIPANTDSTITFSGSYTPTDTGLYVMAYQVSADSATYDQDIIESAFRITEHTWGNDDDRKIIGGVWPSNFATTFRYDIGNTYFVGASPAVVTHCSFGFSQPDSIDGETFDIILYDVDVNLDGTLDGTDYANFQAIALATYTVDASQISANEIVNVELAPFSGDAITLNPNGTYLITVQYDALASPNGNTYQPTYLHASPVSYELVNTMVYSTQLFTGGWAGGQNAVLRLHLDGYLETSTEQVTVLENTKINLFPNPTTELVNIELDLDNVSEAVEATIVDMQGRILQTKSFSNVLNERLQFNVKDYAAGNYFVRVQTSEGVATKQFTVVRK